MATAVAPASGSAASPENAKKSSPSADNFAAVPDGGNGNINDSALPKTTSNKYKLSDFKLIRTLGTGKSRYQPSSVSQTDQFYDKGPSRACA